MRVPGKVNLALRVGARREDGYHELATIFQAVSLYDEVEASLGEGVTCEMLGTQAHLVQVGDNNLAVRAACLLAERFNVTDGVHLVIDKRIPVAGGMAGGSADAAAALLACARLWGVDASFEDLVSLGATLGADVPFALMGGCALGQGRGEVLTPVLSRGTYSWVLAFAHQGLSTPAVFRTLDDMQERVPESMRLASHPPMPADVMRALTTGDPTILAPTLVNDLHAPALALAPSLATTIRAGQEAGALAALLSGSGPTIAFLVSDEYAATDLAVNLSSQGVAREVRVVSGPVSGATVIEEK